MRNNPTNLIGKRFGRLIVTGVSRYVKRTDSNSLRALMLCKCDCGNIIEARANDIGCSINSCKCLQRDIAKNSHTKHGMKYTRFYGVYRSIHYRCYNKNSKAFKNYGERGITLCEEWKDFNNFKRDMYDSYLIHKKNNIYTSLERVNVNKGYSKENCVWANQKEQGNNKRNNIKYKGENASDASKRLGGSPTIVHQRIYNGWKIEDAFNTPIFKANDLRGSYKNNKRKLYEKKRSKENH